MSPTLRFALLTCTLVILLRIRRVDRNEVTTQKPLRLRKSEKKLASREAGRLRRKANRPAAKRAVVEAMDRARADGIIGAPFMVLDGEPFWGADRLDHLERRLAGVKA